MRYHFLCKMKADQSRWVVEGEERKAGQCQVLLHNAQVGHWGVGCRAPEALAWVGGKEK